MGGTIGVVSTRAKAASSTSRPASKLGQCTPVVGRKSPPRRPAGAGGGGHPAPSRARPWSSCSASGGWHPSPRPMPTPPPCASWSARRQQPLPGRADQHPGCPTPKASSWPRRSARRPTRPPASSCWPAKGRRGDGALPRAGHRRLPADAELGTEARTMPALLRPARWTPSCCRWTGSTTRPQPPLITRHSLREQKRQLRILLAEDNPVNRPWRCACWANWVIRSTWPTTARSPALHARSNFDIILMDVQMPVMGGFDATAQIRERRTARPPHTPSSR